MNWRRSHRADPAAHRLANANLEPYEVSPTAVFLHGPPGDLADELVKTVQPE